MGGNRGTSTQRLDAEAMFSGIVERALISNESDTPTQCKDTDQDGEQARSDRSVSKRVAACSRLTLSSSPPLLLLIICFHQSNPMEVDSADADGDAEMKDVDPESDGELHWIHNWDDETESAEDDGTVTARPTTTETALVQSSAWNGEVEL